MLNNDEVVGWLKAIFSLRGKQAAQVTNVQTGQTFYVVTEELFHAAFTPVEEHWAERFNMGSTLEASVEPPIDDAPLAGDFWSRLQQHLNDDGICRE